MFGSRSPQDRLHGAAASGNARKLQRLAQRGVDLHARDAAGKTALQLAVGGFHVEAVRVLVSAGAKLTDAEDALALIAFAERFGASPAGVIEGLRGLVDPDSSLGDVLRLVSNAAKFFTMSESMCVTVRAQLPAHYPADHVPALEAVLHRAAQSDSVRQVLVGIPDHFFDAPPEAPPMTSAIDRHIVVPERPDYSTGFWPGTNIRMGARFDPNRKRR